ncbi:MAG: flavin reductase [Bacteroidales bacterium]|jgi:flavin reductase (DIM6/NTAB) family NADH-FMN oxidoreductase RutF|nr:flavin reductase [Bacteroidales bacterium]
MSKNLFLCSVLLGAIACNQQPSAPEAGNKEQPPAATNIKELSFEALFRKTEPAELTDNVFKLVGQDYTVITAGGETDFNSMTAGWGGWGVLLNAPSTWCMLRANRYTLELMKREKTYTMSYFPDEYKEQVLYYGSQSGRNSDKMKNSPLTWVKTPNGNIAYKEARLVVECKLTEVTTVAPGDFYSDSGREFIESGFNDAKDYHKLVFGEITGVWIKKQ